MKDLSKPGTGGPIKGKVVGQFFGIFNGIPADRYQHIVNTAPFDKCNLLILAFVRTVKSNGVFTAHFTNVRDDQRPATKGDMDQDRVMQVVKRARAMNSEIKILISLGWGNTDAGNAATTPTPFAESVASIVKTCDLDGFDIDYEDEPDVEPKDMFKLARALNDALSKITPTRERIITITPAQEKGLDKNVLDTFTYTMPQSYDHGGDGTKVDWYKDTLGSFDRIVYGLNIEGDIGKSDDPRKFAKEAISNHAAGLFAWRLDNDSVDPQTEYPTFASGKLMWELMHPTEDA